MINPADIHLIPATLNDYPTVQNMARFYIYDRTPFMQWECPEDGLYECIDFKHYFEDSACRTYLIRVKQELAGFVLLDHYQYTKPIDWNVGEFFIIAKFQGQGVAQEVMKQIFNRYRGKWSIAVMPENIRAVQFWRKSVNSYCDNDYTEILKTAEELKTLDNPDPYTMILFHFTIIHA